MHRTAAILTLVSLAALLVSISSSRTDAQSGREQAATPVGAWDVAGVDDADNIWIGTLVVTQDKVQGLKGHIDWLSNNGHSGREHVAGTYEPANRTLKLTGTKLEFANNIVRGTYQAGLSRDGLQLENGKWSDSDPTVPGRWSAKRIDLR